MKRLILLIAVIVLAGCRGTKEVIPEVKNDGIINFKLIQLNDVYEIAPLSGGKYGGMARVAHVADSIRKVEPNTYMFMAGDFLNPSLLGTIKHEGERIMGKQMIDVMNAMDFELVTFGNHEFDVGEEALQKRLNESNFYWTSANVFQNTEDGPRSFHFVRESDTIFVPETYTLSLMDKDSTAIDVGFFSVCLPSNKVDFVHYGDIFLEARSAYVNLDMKRSDVIIGLTHLTIDQDKEIARRLPKVSLIMGGHEHNNMLVPTNNAIIAKADANAKTIYIHTLTYDTKTENLVIDSHLMPIDEKIASKPEVKAVVDKWNAILDKNLKKVVANPYEQIYYARVPLDGTDSASRGIQTNLGGIITQAMAAAFDNTVDGALVNGGSIRIDDMLAGEVTSMDIFRVLPFGGGSLKVELKGSLLKEVLDFGRSKRGAGAYLQRFNFEQNSEGAWTNNGEVLDPDKVYTVAFSDYLLRGRDIPFLNPDHEGVIKIYRPTEEEKAFDIRKSVILYLKSIKS